MVYNDSGSVSQGFYFWDGTRWVKFTHEASNPTTKTTSATLTKNQTFVLVNPATTSATITLPEITAIDNGLEITVKNVGSYDDLVIVDGYGSATIDGADKYYETRWVGITFIASSGNWITKNKENSSDNIMDVHSQSSWTSIEEALAFLEEHMESPMIIRLGDLDYEISSTIVIDLPYALTIQGSSYGNSSIFPDTTALAGKPMFRCKSDCYFKMIDFNNNGAVTYGDGSGEDAIRFLGSGTYNEIKDCTFDGFYNTITDSTNAELWVFETDIENSANNGILLHSDSAGAVLKVAETDFISCKRGVNLDKGSSATIQLASGGYYNGESTDSAIVYHPYTFTDFTSISITGNSWNNTGAYISGFDFTRSDGRDANAILESNAGMADKKPSCYINLLNGSSNTTITTANVWYKANFTNTSSNTCKFTIANNKITFQPSYVRDAMVVITGNLSINYSSQTVSLGLVKNGSSGTRYGETTLRTSTAGTASQFSTTIYLSNISKDDYFEIYLSNTSGGRIVTMLDLNWQVITY